jgi:hypothetical protein
METQSPQPGSTDQTSDRRETQSPQPGSTDQKDQMVRILRNLVIVNLILSCVNTVALVIFSLGIVQIYQAVEDIQNTLQETQATINDFVTAIPLNFLDRFRRRNP